MKAEQKQNEKLFGKDYQKSDYVFTWQDGKPYRPVYVHHAFTKTLKKNNFPHMAFHDLRHSTASILYDKKWELKDIQKWLGHSNIQTTGDIYTHISNLREKNLAEDLNGTFSLTSV